VSAFEMLYQMILVSNQTFFSCGFRWLTWWVSCLGLANHQCEWWSCAAFAWESSCGDNSWQKLLLYCFHVVLLLNCSQWAFVCLELKNIFM